MARMSDFVPAAFSVPREFALELVKMGELLDLGSDASEIGNAVMQRLHGRARDSDYILVAYLLFTKSYKSFQAAQALCRCGCGSEALSLCASTFENVIDLLYIRKARVRRSRRYMQYEQVEKLIQAQKVLRKKRLPKGRRKKYREYERKLLADTAKLVKYFPNPHKGWSQKSLFDRAKAVRGEVAYYERYWIYCAHKHTLPMAAMGLTITSASGRPNLTVGPDIKEVYHAALSSTQEFLRFCLVFDHDFALGLASDIRTIQVELARVAEKVAQEHPELLK
jgi:Family of unknown function (DUF5677)